MNDPSSRGFARMIRSIVIAAAVALPSAASQADTIVTDQAGNRILLKSDGTYQPVPNSAQPRGSSSAGSGFPGTRQTQPPSSANAPSSAMPPAVASPGARNSAAQAPVPGAHYQRYPLDQVRSAAAGTLVSLDGWIGKYGADNQILMFRDRTVAPPFVLLRLRNSGPATSKSSLSSLTARCQAACPIRVKGEVLPHAGEVPTILAHTVDVPG